MIRYTLEDDPMEPEYTPGWLRNIVGPMGPGRTSGSSCELTSGVYLFLEYHPELLSELSDTSSIRYPFYQCSITTIWMQILLFLGLAGNTLVEYTLHLRFLPGNQNNYKQMVVPLWQFKILYIAHIESGWNSE